MMFQFYYAPGTIALAPHIALIEAGVAFEARRVNFSTGEQRSSAYLELNPKGRVPVLVTERGILTETPAILTFIAQTYPAARLAPLSDPFAFAELQSFNAYLCSTVHVAYAHNLRGNRWADDEAALASMRRRVPRSMMECFEVIERQLFKGPWAMGNQFTIADPYLFAITRWLESVGIEVEQYPKVSAHFVQMTAREAVKDVIAMHS